MAIIDELTTDEDGGEEAGEPTVADASDGSVA